MLVRIAVCLILLCASTLSWCQITSLDSLTASNLQLKIEELLNNFDAVEAEKQLPPLASYLAGSERWNDLGKLYFDFSSSFYGSKNVPRAIAYTRKVDSLYTAEKISDIGLKNQATVYECVFLVNQRKLSEAKEKALAVFPNLETEKDTNLLAMTANLLGNIHYYQRRLSPAIEWYQRYCNLEPNKFAGYRNLSNVYSELGNEEHAVKNLLKAKEIIEGEEPSHVNRLYLISTLAILARNATSSENLSLARVYLSQANAIIPLLPESLRNHAIILEFYADYIHYSTAARLIDSAFIYLNKLEAQPSLHTCVSYGHIANYYERVKQYDKQLEYTTKLGECMDATKAYQISPAYKNFYLTHHSRALIHQSKNEQAIQLVNSYYTDTADINYHPDIDLVMNSFRNQNLLHTKSWAAIKAYRESVDVDYLTNSKRSCELLDTLIFSTIRRQASKLASVRYHRNYGLAQQVAAEEWVKDPSQINFNKALEYSEKMRSLFLMSHLTSLVEQGENDELKDLQLQERKLNEYVDYLTESVSESSGENESILQKIDSINREILIIKDKIDEINPTYYAQRFKNKFPKLSAVQRKLKANQKLLSFSVFDDIAVVLEITRTDANIQINPVPLLDQHIDSLLFQLHHQGSEYDRWLGFINKNLMRGVDVKSHPHFIVIPDLKLSNIPFELIIQEENPKANIQNTHSISYWQSESAADNHSGDVLALAATSTEASSQDFLNATRNYLTFLPNVASEIDDIRDILGSSVTTINQATKNEFIKQASNYGVIHLAMHSIMNNKKPTHSHLVFYDDSNSTAGNLYSYEIRNLNIPAQLVCLSSCNSGTGKYIDGEGIASLGLAFNYAGCPNTVQSLWPVSDASTSLLMKYFYTNLKDGLNKPAALAEAKRQFVANAPETLQHPYFWSGFVYYGDDLPLEISRDYAWVWYLLSTVLIMFLIYLFNKRKRRR